MWAIYSLSLAFPPRSRGFDSSVCLWYGSCLWWHLCFTCLFGTLIITLKKYVIILFWISGHHWKRKMVFLFFSRLVKFNSKMKYVVTCFRYNFIIRSLKVVWDTALINVLFSVFLNYSSQMVGYLCCGWRFPAEVVWLLKRNMWWCHKMTVIELLGMLAPARLLSRPSCIWEVSLLTKRFDTSSMFAQCSHCAGRMQTKNDAALYCGRKHFANTSVQNSSCEWKPTKALQ